MTNIIIRLSQYFILILMAVYTFLCFAVFRYNSEEDRQGIYIKQIFSMILICFLGFLSLFCSTGDSKYLFMYMIMQLGIIGIILLYKYIYPAANKLIVNNMCMLLTIGFIILSRISTAKAMRQFYICCGSVLVTLAVPYLISRISFFEKFKWVYCIVGISSLAVVLLFSSLTYGSKINITVSGYTFAPSEYVKIVFVFAVASILTLRKGFRDIVISALIAAAHILLLVASRDLGSAIIFFVVYICMLFVCTRNYFLFLGGFVCAGLASIAGYKMFSHVRVRVLAFTDPLGNIEDAGYQIAQSLFAIGTGGWMGMGLGRGAPNNIPVVAADFIFSAICEEFGVIFGMLLILVCVSCFIMFMNIAMRFHDTFFKLVAVGLAVAYAFQVLLTIGGVTKFIPLTGVTLPLVSYGGTSIAVTCCVFSIIQGLYIYRKINKTRSIIRPMDTGIEFIDVDNITTEEEHSNKADFGGTVMDTVMMDEAFFKAVQEGISYSEIPDIIPDEE